MEQDLWQGVDRGLFEHLRQVRRSIAEDRGVPAFVVFSDATLRDMALKQPETLAAMHNVRGVGEQKLADLGARFVEAIAEYRREHVVVTHGIKVGHSG
jgi:ATP-dependent DNA helicase RecQ